MHTTGPRSAHGPTPPGNKLAPPAQCARDSHSRTGGGATSDDDTHSTSDSQTRLGVVVNSDPPIEPTDKPTATFTAADGWVTDPTEKDTE